jgi:DNA-binding winged helix-turn-helix (wHTH) protein
MIPAFRLRDRIVDPSLNRVTFGGKTVQVEPKIMTVLVALVERPGELVTREELLGRAWSGVFVTDDVLHRAIREIRRLFDDDSEQPRVIETIRKRGYRLLAPVHGLDKLDGLEPVASPTISPAGHPDVRRRGKVAVVFGLLVVVLAALAAGVAVGRRSSVTTEAHVRFVPLTSDPGNEVDPALSASGRLAYVARGDDGRAHIFT